MSDNDKKPTTNVPSHTPIPRRRRVAKPPTTPKQIEAARKRRDELVAVLTLRGRPVHREALRRDAASTIPPVAAAARKQLALLDRGPYARAAAAYLLTHDKFAWQEARKAEARHVDVEDLVQAARIGMLKGLDRFDADLVTAGVVTSFLSYARWWVRCEIGRALDDEALVKVPSTARKAATDMRRDLADHCELVKAAPESLTDADVAEALRLPLEKVRLLRNLHLGHEHYEVTTLGDGHRDDSKASGPHGVVVERMTEVGDAQAADALGKRRDGALEHAMTRLSPLQRRLVCEEYGLQMDQAALATRSRAGSVASFKALLKAALARLRGLLEGDAGAVMFCA